MSELALDRERLMSLMETLINPKSEFEARSDAAWEIADLDHIRTSQAVITVLAQLTASLIKVRARVAGCDTDDVLREYLPEINRCFEEVPND